MFLNIKEALILSNIMGTILYGAWIALSLGFIVASQSTILLLLLIHLVILMYVLENISVKVVQDDTNHWSNFIPKIFLIAMLSLLILGKLVFWWNWIGFYIILISYIAIRRPDLFDITNWI